MARRNIGGLSETERMFCISFARCNSIAIAAINAGLSLYDGEGLLARKDIKAEIKKLKKARAMRHVISADDILERQMQIAFADITEFVDFGTEEITVYDKKTNEETTKIVNNVYLKNSRDIDGGVVSEVWRTADGAARIKLCDRQRALEWLSRYFNMYPMDKHRVEYDEMRLKLAEAGKLSKHESPIEITLTSKESNQSDEGFYTGYDDDSDFSSEDGDYDE